MRGRIRQASAALAGWARRWWWAVLLALAVLGGVALGIVLSQRVADQAAPLMEQTAQITEPDKRISAQKDLLQYQADNQVKIWTTLAQATLALAAAIGGYFAYRNLLVMQERLDVDRQAQITTRFTQAIGQLGAELKDGKPHLEVRLGGIYALERIAKDSPRDNWTIMEVLTAYVRQNAPRSRSSPSDSADSSSPELPREETPKSEELAKPRTDIQAVLTVLGRRTLSQEWPEPGRLDLSANLSAAFLVGANLVEAYLREADLSLADFRGADLSAAFLVGANLREADLSDADLSGADLSEAFLIGADYRGAILVGADLRGADLRGALNLTADQVKSAASHSGARLPPRIAEELGEFSADP